MNKSIYLSSFIFLYIFSFLFVDNLFIDTYINLRFYYTDIFFLIVFLIFIIFNFKSFCVFVMNLKQYNFFEFIIFLILLIKIFKYSLDFNNFSNLYEFIRFSYILTLYIFFKYLLIKINGSRKLILDLFIVIFLLSIFLVFLSFIIYLLGFKDLPIELWQIKNIQYPYLGKNVLHFDGFLNYYNMQAYIMIPGFFIFINTKLSHKPFLSLLTLIVFCLILFIIKSKILVLVSTIGFLYLLFVNINFLKQKKIILIFLLSLIIIFYLFITHFLAINEMNILDFDDYNLYFTSEPIFNLYHFDFYGSLFFKLKVVSIEHFKSFNFIFFNSINYNEYFSEYILNINKSYSGISSLDPHSEIFSAISNYGFIGLILIIIFLYYPFHCLLNKNNFHDILNNKSLTISLSFICVIFSIESFNADIIHFRFYWILLALLSVNLYQKKKLNS